MSLKIKCHPNEMSLKLEFHLKLIVTQNWISLKLEFHLNCNVTQNKMVFKLDCHLNLNVTQIGIPLKLKMPLKDESHSKMKVAQIWMSLYNEWFIISKYWFCAISLLFTSIPAMTKHIITLYDSVKCYHSNWNVTQIGISLNL